MGFRLIFLIFNHGHIGYIASHFRHEGGHEWHDMAKSLMKKFNLGVKFQCYVSGKSAYKLLPPDEGSFISQIFESQIL